jgi:hypothetical protein
MNSYIRGSKKDSDRCGRHQIGTLRRKIHQLRLREDCNRFNRDLLRFEQIEAGTRA